MIIKTSAKGIILKDEDFFTGNGNGGFSEYDSRIKLPFADINVKQWYFSGIAIHHLSCDYYDYGKFIWQKNADTISLLINLKGKLILNSSSFKHAIIFNNSQHNIFYTPDRTFTIKNGELKSEMLLIDFTGKAFDAIVGETDSRLKQLIVSSGNNKFIIFSERSLYIDISISNAVKAIILCEMKDKLKKLYFYSKCMEILALQVEALNRENMKTTIYCKTDYDKERVMFARDYMLENMENPPHIAELALIAGINEFKLKHGFRELFNTTIYGYLSDTRLEIAREELMLGNKTTTEIAFTLGYSSLQHFSKAFKAKYGISPIKARQTKMIL